MGCEKPAKRDYREEISILVHFQDDIAVNTPHLISLTKCSNREQKQQVYGIANWE